MHSYTDTGARTGVRRTRTLAFALLSALLLVPGCRDEGTAPVPREIARGGEADQGDDPCDLCNGDGGGGDPKDSHFSADVVTSTVTTLTSDVPFYDPTTDQTVTSLTFPAVRDSMRFAAAYDAQGTVLMSFAQAPDDEIGIARTQVVGDNVTLWDANGAVIPDTVVGPFLLEQAGGTFAGVVVTDTAVYRDDSAMPYLKAPAATSDASAIRPPSRAARKPSLPGVSVVGSEMRITSSLDDPAAGRRGTQVRTYRRSRDAWVIAAERIDEQIVAGGLTTARTSVTSYRNVHWNVNAERNAARRVERARKLAELAATRARSAATPRRPVLETATAGLRTAAYARPAKTAGGTASATASNLPLVLQHGAFSDASTWNTFEPRLNQAYTFPVTVRRSLDWKQPITQQGRQLRDHMLETGQAGFLVIGHSNGGLVSRWAGQQSAGLPGSLTKGVVTIGTPNTGVPFAKNARTVANQLLTSLLGKVTSAATSRCGNEKFQKICDRINESKADWLPRVIDMAFDNAIPMTVDVQPGSAFLNSLNTANEGFYKWGVAVKSEGRWQWMRMLGDWKYPPGHSLDGEHLQNYMHSLYHTLRHCSNQVVLGFIRKDIADACRNTRWALNDMDQTWQRLTDNKVDREGGDGLVPTYSQRYPNTPGPVPQQVEFANVQMSHVSETKSRAIADKITSTVIPYLTTR